MNYPVLIDVFYHDKDYGKETIGILVLLLLPFWELSTNKGFQMNETDKKRR